VARLDYYTGLTFKIYVAGAGARAGGGGRYDTLTAGFGKAEAAVGFVLQLDVLADHLTNNAELVSAAKTKTTVLRSDENDVKRLFREALTRRVSNECLMINLDGEAACRN
jgi:ATP phosphoribosyltransferase regulatory subunit HisZ